MKTATRVAAATIAAFAALTMSACSDPETGVQPSAPPSQSATEPPQTEPADEEPAEVEATEEPVDPDVGDIIAADEIEQARDTGAAVYVSPTGDGTGVVIDPRDETPEVILRDVEAVPSVASTSMEDGGRLAQQRVELNRAIVDAGSGVFMLTEAPHYVGLELAGVDYVVYAFGDFEQLDEYKADPDIIQSTKSAAVEAAQPYMDANPDFAFIDATR